MGELGGAERGGDHLVWTADGRRSFVHLQWSACDMRQPGRLQQGTRRLIHGIDAGQQGAAALLFSPGHQ
jgi:hypothetical protein